MESNNRPATNLPRWALLSKHGMVVIALAMTPSLTSRQLAAQMGLTERTLFTHCRAHEFRAVLGVDFGQGQQRITPPNQWFKNPK